MTDVIGNIVSDKTNINNQLSNNPDVLPTLKKFNNSIQMEHLVTKIVSKNISGSMIWGSEPFGQWGTASWGGAEGKSLVLNSPTQGILGTNVLGDGTLLETLYAVLPRNNEFKEYFGQDLFINTSASTGTLNASTGTYSLAPGEILESEVIAKLRSPINSVSFIQADGLTDEDGGMALGSLQLGITTFAANNVSVEFSNDSGVTWHGANTIDKFLFPSSTPDDELKYRITAVTAIDIEPLVFKIN